MNRVSRAVLVALVAVGWIPAAIAGAEQGIRDHTTAMLKDAEEMVAHGGMGDAKAIVHHCGEVSRHAEAILKALVPADPRAKAAASHLQEAIRYCQRVAEMGDKVDPGASLNPATKARTAARDAAKHLATVKAGGA
ncbi:MAG: hypothetical protein KGO52_05980 [Nitrospirota bacterium]|nr:hypothetical protein [Nitrospirota bacterium]MDE3036112.1 hypothetical protein [Nitrospirota bacterium]MDE3119153.1 hypothetical protein [Nitrospirota bacterium]MDE3242249.1 hypothetical protein [Nitrospirota bacterium]